MIYQTPAIRGKIGDWTYYLSKLKFKQATGLLKFAHEVNNKTQLDFLIQRELTKRSEQIAGYLLAADQRFLGALVVAKMDGVISFAATHGDVGQLSLDTNDIYYALDGQHRLKAMQEAVVQNANRFGADEISLIIIGHDTTAEGYKRARRLFTTINRYARQTDKAVNYIMDEDDGISQMLLRNIREFSFFDKHTKYVKLKNDGTKTLNTSVAMTRKDSKYLMSVRSLYEVISALIPTEFKPHFTQKGKNKTLPEGTILEDAWFEAWSYLEELLKIVQPWKELEAGTITDINVYRFNKPRHVLVRPVAIVPFCQAYLLARESGKTAAAIQPIVKKFANLDATPWRGLIMNPRTGNMIVNNEVKHIAFDVWRCLLGLVSKPEKAKIQKKWKTKVDPRNSNPNLKLP